MDTPESVGPTSVAAGAGDREADTHAAGLGDCMLTSVAAGAGDRETRPERTVGRLTNGMNGMNGTNGTNGTNGASAA